MKTLFIANNKGGVGKTAVSYNMALTAHLEGYRTAVMDSDWPQGSLSKLWAMRKDNKPYLLKTNWMGLKDLLGTVGDSLDLVIIDGAANSGRLVIEDGVRASDLTLVPTSYSTEDRTGIGVPLEAITRHLDKSWVVITRTQASRTGFSETAKTKELRDKLTLKGFNVAPQSTRFVEGYSDAARVGKSLLEFQPRSLAARDFRRLWAWTRDQLQLGEPNE